MLKRCRVRVLDNWKEGCCMNSESRNVPDDFMEGQIRKSYDEVFELICRNAKISGSSNARFFIVLILIM